MIPRRSNLGVSGMANVRAGELSSASYGKDRNLEQPKAVSLSKVV
jgi:hypothetical protein